MFRAESLATIIDSHPYIFLSLAFPNQDQSNNTDSHNNQPIYPAGEEIILTLQLECTIDHVSSLGRIELELIGREHVATSDIWTEKVFWQTSVAFQGPGLPISNACEKPSTSLASSTNYHPALKGVTTFPIRLALPSSLPTSFSTPTSFIDYTIHALVDILDFPSTEFTLRTSTGITILPNLNSITYRSFVGEKSVTKQVGYGDGPLEMEVKSISEWGVEGSESRLVVNVKNGTETQTLSPSLTIVQRVTMTQADGKEVTLDNIVSQHSYAEPRHIFAASSLNSMYLDYTIPSGIRTISPSEYSTIRVDIFIRVDIPLDIVNGLKCTATLPIYVLHPSSLPADMWLEHQSLQTELRDSITSLSSAPKTPKAQRRWSAPLQAVIGALSPLSTPQSTKHPAIQSIATFEPRRPRLHQSRHSISGLPMDPDIHPFSAYRSPYHPLPKAPISSAEHPKPPTDHTYSLPTWGLYAVHEEDESQNTKTSNHPRDISGSRGRSVSLTQHQVTACQDEPWRFEPQTPDHNTERYPSSHQEPTSIPLNAAGQPPLTGNLDTLVTSPPTTVTITSPTLPRDISSATISDGTIRTISPELLSPKPLIFTDPESYFDSRIVETSENSLENDGNKRLNRDTIKSLEAMVIDDGHDQGRRDSVQSEDGKGSARRRSTRRGSENRHSILNMFDQESRSSEDGSDLGIYKAREHRISDHQVAPSDVVVFDRVEGSEEASSGKAIPEIPSHAHTTSPEQKVDPKKSARGGKGGRVTSARQLFETNDVIQPSTKSPPAGKLVEERKERHLLPPNMLLTNVRRASTGITSAISPSAGIERSTANSSYTRSMSGSVNGNNQGDNVAVGKLRGLIEKYESVSGTP